MVVESNPRVEVKMPGEIPAREEVAQIKEEISIVPNVQIADRDLTPVLPVVEKSRERS